MNNILITGGLGYIGSNLVLQLIKEGYNVTIIDNLSNSSLDVLKELENLTQKPISFFNIDIRHKESLKNIFESISFDTVFHLAALTSIPESYQNKQLYLDINLESSKVLLSLCEKYLVYNFIFASSGSIYNIVYNNPYTDSKFKFETYMLDRCIKNSDLNCLSLRYFNPIGTNLNTFNNKMSLPYNLNRALLTYQDHLSIYGNSSKDFIHIDDLVSANISALESSFRSYDFLDIGTGVPTRVLTFIVEYLKYNNLENLNIRLEKLRKGDLENSLVSDNTFQELTGWKPTKTIKDMCISSFNHAIKNPDFYR